MQIHSESAFLSIDGRDAWGNEDGTTIVDVGPEDDMGAVEIKIRAGDREVILWLYDKEARQLAAGIVETVDSAAAV
jgi:hypothetical protein